MMLEGHKVETVYLKSSNKHLQDRKVESEQKSDIKEKFKTNLPLASIFPESWSQKYCRWVS